MSRVGLLLTDELCAAVDEALDSRARSKSSGGVVLTADEYDVLGRDRGEGRISVAGLRILRKYLDSLGTSDSLAGTSEGHAKDEDEGEGTGTKRDSRTGGRSISSILRNHGDIKTKLVFPTLTVRALLCD
jgi:hypothetical protein